MRESIWKDATRQGGGEYNGGDSHDEQHGDGVFTANGDEIWGIGVVASADDVNECAVVVSEVHCKREAVTMQAPIIAIPCPEGLHQTRYSSFVA